MNGEVHLHRKVVGSLNIGFLPIVLNTHTLSIGDADLTPT